MSSLKRFDCPSCGRDSWLDPATLAITHAEPHCEAWKTKQHETIAEGALVRGGNVVLLRPPPSVVDFACPGCNAPARLRPQARPIEVQHSLPSCELWKSIEQKEDAIERFLIKAGVHMHVPEHRD